MKSGVYAIINKSNGKYYIGSSKDISKRFSCHKASLRGGYHDNPKLQNAWNKYGEEYFDFIILQLVDEDNLLQEEQKYINDLDATHNGYNICREAGKPPGIQWDEHYRQHFSNLMKGRIFTDEHKRNLSVSLKGRNLGKKLPTETRYKMHSAQLGYKNHFYGKTHSDETKKLIGEKSRYRCNKLSKEDVIDIKHMLHGGATNTEIAKKYNVNQSSISNIKTGKSWVHIIVSDLV